MNTSYKHRLSIIALKYAPIIGAFVMWIHVILLLCGISPIIADYALSTPIIPGAICYLWSKTFGFCPMHRIFILYIVLVTYCIKIQGTFGFGALLLGARWIVVIIGLILFIWFVIRLKKYKYKCFNNGKILR